jgi:hypothetical protein
VLSTGVRLRWLIVLAALCLTACAGQPATPATTSRESSPGQAGHVTPSRIGALRTAFPPGYQVGEVSSPRSPAGSWGLGADFTADPAACAALANPVSGDAPPQGIAASGPGGIVYAVVVASAPPPTLDPAVVADCAHWSMGAGRTSATVDLTPAPDIQGVATLGMATATRTVVEGGNETDGQIRTVTAYLGDYLVFVALVTDPGSPQPALPPDFADTMLVTAVATLRA